jgi:short subunit dehydrogenase-like uncharacterized protein
MADIVLFGATGYTGRLTAAVLHGKGADFAIAGRNPDKLQALAATTGSPETMVVSVGDTDGLVKALSGARVLLTCVGPFEKLGHTALEAALRAGVHYVDSTGEGTFIRTMIDGFHERALDARIALAPALGFDEVPGDVASTLATAGMDRADVTVTYALPRTASAGTIRSAMGVVTEPGTWLEGGALRVIRAGAEQRWAPMPEPLGPRRAVSFPLALGQLAPLHLDLSGFRTYITTGNLLEAGAMRFGAPVLGALLKGPGAGLIERAVARLPEGPGEGQRERGRWTILAEARAGREWRNITLQGTDVYGLTSHTLAMAAIALAQDGYDKKGVLAPVAAVGLDELRRALADHGVVIETYAPV